MSDLVKIDKKFGSALLKEAEHRATEEVKDSVVSFAKRIMQDRETALEWSARNKRAADFCAEQLEAIEKGKFSIYRGQIIFANVNLNMTMSGFLNSEQSKL